MSKKPLAMHVVTNHKKVGDKVYRSHLLCHGYREDGKVKKKTLANLSHLSDSIVEIIRQALKGNPGKTPSPETAPFVADDGQPLQVLEPGATPSVMSNRFHGQVMVVLEVMRRLGLGEMISRRPCPERNLVLAMIVNRIIMPRSKLATVSWWKTNTLVDELGLGDVDEDDLYDAMDWLYPRQAGIEKVLAKRHLEEGGSAMYDLSSTYLEGGACELAEYGYSRDKKRGKVQINFGLLADREGRPVSIEVYPGNRTDSATFCPVVEKIRNEFNLEKILIVGDRGMIGTKNIEILKGMVNIDWITALRSVSIKKLIKENKVQPSLFDERNILEIYAPDDYPDERLIFCRNPALARRRKETRLQLLVKTDEALEKIKKRVEADRLNGEGKINMSVGRVIDKFHMKKHFILEIKDTIFNYMYDKQSIKTEEIMDGIYVIRTSLKKETMQSEDVVREYKKLTNIERAFRCIKTEDLRLRPIYHYDEKRVKTHIFICMLAYYVLWYLKEAWRPLTFGDEELELKKFNDPVAPSKQSKSAIKKVKSKISKDGFELSSFRCLFDRFGTITNSIVELKLKNLPPIRYNVQSDMDAHQEKAFKLLDTIRVL
jgi:transposase